MDFEINIISEFNIGGFIIPFYFSIDKVQENPTNVLVENECILSNNSEFEIENFENKVFKYVYLDKLKIKNSEDFDYILSKYKESTDYNLENDIITIKSKGLFFEFIYEIEEVYYGDNTLESIKNYVLSQEIEMIKIFSKRLDNYINYNDEKDRFGNNNTHRLQWALGETSTNTNPYFKENIGKATSDWSLRELMLRDKYKSKVYMMEHARNKWQEEQLKLKEVKK